MSLVIYKCRICTVFWYKRRLIGLGARSEAPRQNFEHGCGRDSDCAPGTSTAAKKGLLHCCMRILDGATRGTQPTCVC